MPHPAPSGQRARNAVQKPTFQTQSFPLHNPLFGGFRLVPFFYFHPKHASTSSSINPSPVQPVGLCIGLSVYRSVFRSVAHSLARSVCRSSDSFSPYRLPEAMARRYVSLSEKSIWADPLAALGHSRVFSWAPITLTLSQSLTGRDCVSVTLCNLEFRNFGVLRHEIVRTARRPPGRLCGCCPEPPSRIRSQPLPSGYREPSGRCVQSGKLTPTCRLNSLVFLCPGTCLL